MNSAELGRAGERCVEWRYRLRGYRILERNFRTRSGEIDLIVQKDRTLVFVEVKTRGRHMVGQPCEAVGIAKQRRIILAAKAYLTRISEDVFVRFDVAEVYADAVPYRIRCIENAFEIE